VISSRLKAGADRPGATAGRVQTESSRDPGGLRGTSTPVSRAGGLYALLWVVIVGARAVLSYGSAHWFTIQIVSWAVANQVSEAAITDGLIFMAIAMVLTRTLGLGLRASRLASPGPVPALA